ncbi:hypothetical protein ACTFIY_001185 [Dictyostelium cf. discoideum]
MKNDIIIENSNSKCTHHTNKKIKLLCLNCKFIPCCIQCISQDGEHHGHKTNSIDSVATSNILKMMILYKNDIIPKLKEKIENNKQIINESDNIYNEIKQQYENNKNLVLNEFNEFHKYFKFFNLTLKGN